MAKMKIPCPTCHNEVEYKTDNPHRPFCSERCKLIDLGAWAAEEHSIPGESMVDDLMSEDINRDQLH